MRKTGLVVIIFFTTLTVYGAFSKPKPEDSAQSVSSPSSSPGKLFIEQYKHVFGKHFLPIQNLGLSHQKFQTRKHKKAQWLVGVAGFMLGLTGIGYAISRLTKNDTLRDGAALGFRVFLYIVGIYLVALLVFLLLFYLLGGWR